MGKEFVEYKSENGRIPYTAPQLCFCLTQYAKDYILENHSIISNIDKKVRDAVLVDAINYLGMQGCCDFALYTHDLYNEEKHEERVDGQCLLTAIIYCYAYYMFDEGIVESVLRNKHMNECTEEFDADNGAIVLLDFINYIAKRNDYDRTFTIEDLYEKFKVQKHNYELNQLKKFLELTGEYNEKLASGEKIDKMFLNMARENDLQYIAEDGTYHYTDKIKERVGYSEMNPWDAGKVEEKICAMAYAFAKLNPDKNSNVQAIDKKILEMKKN